MTLLKTIDLVKRFDGVCAVDKVNASIEKGEVVGMIGPNGSGKTTYINILSGIYKPTNGKIIFKDSDISNLPAHEITKAGISRTFQNLRVFTNISILENILIGRHCRIPNSLMKIYFNPFKSFEIEKQAKNKAISIIEEAGISADYNQLARSLSYGEQRRLEICRALASEPDLLLLDEPCAGMNSTEMDALKQFLKKINDRGTTIFVIEHNMNFITSVADRVIVLNAGGKFKEGLPNEIMKDKEVQKIYLGDEEDY